jgi:hypothetical protein
MVALPPRAHTCCGLAVMFSTASRKPRQVHDAPGGRVALLNGALPHRSSARNFNYILTLVLGSPFLRQACLPPAVRRSVNWNGSGVSRTKRRLRRGMEWGGKAIVVMHKVYRIGEPPEMPTAREFVAQATIRYFLTYCLPFFCWTSSASSFL